MLKRIAYKEYIDDNNTSTESKDKSEDKDTISPWRQICLRQGYKGTWNQASRIQVRGGLLGYKC